jgi:DNA-binding beta-propeller fold protein YncE
MRFLRRRGAIGVCLLAGVAAIASGQKRPDVKRPDVKRPDTERPGVERGTTLLPNGWRIAPAGRHMTVGDLPLAMVESADGRFLIVTNNGYSRPSLTVVDLKTFTVRSRVPLDNAWLGLAWNPDRSRLYSSGAAANTVEEFRFEKGRLTPAASYPITKREKGGETFIGGVAVSPDGGRVYAVNVLGQSLSVVDPATREVRSVPLPAEPYTCLAPPDGRSVLVSLWGGAKILIFDAATLAPAGEIPVGEHPNAMALSPDGSRVFVACANTNSVWVVDLFSRTAKEQISIALYPDAPPGSTPNGLGISPDGATLLVANADNNTVAVADVSRPGESRVAGFLPAGWYPTAAAFSRDGSRVFVLSGKGLTSSPNPRGRQPAVPEASGQYIGALLQGSLSVLPAPGPAALAAYTRTVYSVTPYSDATRLSPARAPRQSPVPRKVGGSSPIKHVFYVIRENRTYDQVLGDMPEGNGDPTLCLFGEDVTPNAHALARDFVLLDNFYVDAEVSYDGHAYSTGAYATDVVEKIWPMNYASRGGRYLSEGGGAMRNAYGNLSAPASGYIWDACVRAGVSVRSYGEFVEDPNPARDRRQDKRVAGEFQTGQGPYKASVPGLEGRIAPYYPPFDLSIPDERRVEAWLKEFREFEKSGTLPSLSILRLGGDHTAYVRAGFPTPRSMIAENDQALGRLVEAVSASRYWKDSAIFVLEDDAQNGPDHVDAHRSVALVVSPWARRRAVDSTLLTTCGVLRTIELVLGLAPMSQCDAAAAPMYRAFQSKPDLAPYRRREARVPVDEMNDPSAPDAAASLGLDLEEADRVPDIAGNEILWRAVRGASCPMPPPVRAAFVRPVRPSPNAAKDADD